jgi:hypothetical protein
MVISNRKPMKQQSKYKTNAAGSLLYNCLAGVLKLYTMTPVTFGGDGRRP